MSSLPGEKSLFFSITLCLKAELAGSVKILLRSSGGLLKASQNLNFVSPSMAAELQPCGAKPLVMAFSLTDQFQLFL